MKLSFECLICYMHKGSSFQELNLQLREVEETDELWLVLKHQLLNFFALVKSPN